MTSAPQSWDTAPTADEYAAIGRQRRLTFALAALALSLAVGASFVAFGLDTPVVPGVLLIGVVLPIVLWHRPQAAFYLTFAAVCLFEMFQTPYSDALTDRVPFFWNINTIFQTYAHADFKGVPLNLMEVILLLAGVCSFLRAVYTRSVGLRGGPLLVPIGVYMGFVTLGWINGMATGGDFKISLQEVRSQFYFLLAYLMAVNIVRDRRQITGLLWTFVVCVGLKGILYTFRRYVTLAGMPLPDQGVGSHEEAFLFNCFEVLLLVLSVCKVHPRLRALMWCLLPFVVTGNLACNRRAATAALAIALPIFLLGAYQALPRRRYAIALLGAFLTVSFSIYYPAFKNSDSLFAQPARAIRSQFQPDARDASSNAYRDAEDADLYATIKSAPLQGYGYGKRMFHAVPIADISKEYEWWDIMTHDQVLWVWMRVGTLGFVAFWTMVSAILIRAGRLLREEGAGDETKAAAMFTLLMTTMLMIFGLLDLQLSNFRDMLFVGFWAGVLASLVRRPEGRIA